MAKGIQGTCWNCGESLADGEKSHHLQGGIAILCKCGATTVAMILSNNPGKVKETVSAKKAPPALKLKKAKNLAKRGK